MRPTCVVTQSATCCFVTSANDARTDAGVGTRCSSGMQLTRPVNHSCFADLLIACIDRTETLTTECSSGVARPVVTKTQIQERTSPIDCEVRTRRDVSTRQSLRPASHWHRDADTVRWQTSRTPIDRYSRSMSSVFHWRAAFTSSTSMSSRRSAWPSSGKLSASIPITTINFSSPIWHE